MKRWLIAASAGIITLLAFGAITASAAPVSAKQASLDEQQGACTDAGGTITSWHFIINQIRSDPVPPSITVHWSNGDTEIVPLAKTSGPVAHYNVYGSAMHTLITSATADIYDGWSGQFNLSDTQCAQGQDACTASGDRIVVRFDELLYQFNQSSDPVAVDIAAGTYSVTLQSFDDHLGHPGQNQKVERWHASFDTAAGTVDTNAISDLPEEPITTLTQNVGTITLAADATSVTAVHFLAGGTFSTPESVTAVCVALDPVAD